MKKNNFLLYLLCIAKCIVADDATTYHHYFLANRYHFSGNISRAQDWYKKLFSANNSVYTYKGYLSFLADTQQFKHIIELMPSLNKKFAQDPDIQLIFVQALEQTNHVKAADNHIIVLSQSFKTHPEITLRAAQTYIKRKEPESALLTINSFLNNTPRRPNNFVFYFLQSHIYTQLNQFPRALESVQKCLEMHPQFDKGWLLCASLHEKEGKIKEALAGYTTFLELSGGNSDIEKHLFSLMLKNKMIENSTPLFMPSNGINSDNVLVLFKQQRYTQALTHVNTCIAQQPHNDECKLLKIQILSAMKNFNHAASALTTWIEEDAHNAMWPKTLCLLVYNGMPHALIIETFAAILAKNPDNVWCNLYCADMCMRNAQHDTALTYLTKALPSITTAELAAQTAYQVALLHYERNNYNFMHSYLEKAYALNGSCPHINNALAYYWATKGKDVNKAHHFIAKSLQCDSTNPYFLDTHALILYKEKKYTHAQHILEKLVNHNNSTMLLHLAKVHYALNNKEIADTFVKKAQHLVKNEQEKKALHKMQLLLAQT